MKNRNHFGLLRRRWPSVQKAVWPLGTRSLHLQGQMGCDPTRPHQPKKDVGEPVGNVEKYGDIVEPADAMFELLEFLSTTRIALLRGACQSGKTSLIQRIIYYSNPKNKCPGSAAVRLLQSWKCVLAPQAAKVAVLSRDESDQLSASVANKLVLIDEAHTWFGHPDCQQYLIEWLKNPSETRVLFVTTSTTKDTVLKDATPKELDDKQWWFYGPSINSQQVITFIDQNLPPYVRRGARGPIARQLFDTCGHNMGLIQQYLKEWKSRKYVGFDPQLVENCRVVAGGNGPWGDEFKEGLRTILAEGMLNPTTGIISEEIRKKIRSGILCPKPPTADNKAIVKLPSSTDKVQPIVPSSHFLFELARRTVTPPLVSCHFVPNSADDCFLHVLPCMASHQFRYRLDKARLLLSEPSLQHSFGKALSWARLPHAAEVPVAQDPDPIVKQDKKEQRGKKPTVDFVVTLWNAQTNNLKTFAIEFCTDNLRYAEHLERFQAPSQHNKVQSTKGIYSSYADFVVVGFESSPVTAPNFPTVAKDLLERFILVAPHPCHGWSCFCVHRPNRATTYFWNNGVLARPNGEPATSRNMDDGRLWVRYTDYTFEVAPSKNNVDSLKKAVKAEVEANKPLKVDALSMIVKDKDGKVLEEDAPLAGNTKKTAYIVE